MVQKNAQKPESYRADDRRGQQTDDLQEIRQKALDLERNQGVG